MYFKIDLKWVSIHIITGILTFSLTPGVTSLLTPTWGFASKTAQAQWSMHEITLRGEALMLDGNLFETEIVGELASLTPCVLYF